MDFQFLKQQDLTPVIQREIEDFLDRQSNSHPFQFPDWTAERPERSSVSPYYAIVRDQGRVRWFASCGVSLPMGKWLHRVRSLTVYRGPACDDLEVTLYGLRRLVETGKELGFVCLEIVPDWIERPEWSAGDALLREGWTALAGAGVSLRLDLRVGEDELFRSFRKGTRYEIRRSEQQGVLVRLAESDDDLDSLHQVYSAMALRKKFDSGDAARQSHVLRWIARNKDRGAVLLAFKDAELLGGTLVVRAGSRAWYILGATTKNHRLSAGHLLQWHAIRWAKEHRCTEYDFGGYREGAETGPALFKRGFCQAVVRFTPAYRLPLHRQLYSMVNFALRARSARTDPVRLEEAKAPTV